MTFGVTHRRCLMTSTALLMLCVLSTSLAANDVPPIKPAMRIATTAPSLTELVFAAGAGNRLVAVSAFSDYPVEAKKLPQIADFNGINIEALLVSKPDLVLVWRGGTRETDIVRLQKLGIAVEAIGVVSLEDVPQALRRIGQLAGSLPAADVAAGLFSSRLAALKSRYHGAARMPVFFEISRIPLMTINGTHFISEVLRVCGGDNVFAGVAQMVFEPSREALLQKNPRVVFYTVSKSGKPPAARDNTLYLGLDAVAAGNVIALDADSLLRPGPRLIDAVTETCAALDQGRRRQINKN